MSQFFNNKNWTLVGKRTEQLFEEKQKTEDLLHMMLPPTIGCANKDLDGSLGPLGKFIEYCRIVELLPVIPLPYNW